MTATHKPTVDEIDAAIAAATPELSQADRRLVAGIYRALATGRRARPQDLATRLGIDEGAVERRLATWPGVFRDDDGAIIGFWGLALDGMPHRMLLEDGTEVRAWCAWDPLFIAPIVGRVRVETTDPESSRAISYTVDADGVVHADDGQVLSFLEPADGWGEDVLGTFCHYVLHFENSETGRAWTDEHDGTFLLPLPDAVELGRRHADRIAGS